MLNSGYSNMPVKVSIKSSCQVVCLGIAEVLSFTLSVGHVLFSFDNKILALNILAVLNQEVINQVPIQLNYVAHERRLVRFFRVHEPKIRLKLRSQEALTFFISVLVCLFLPGLFPTLNSLNPRQSCSVSFATANQ